MASTSHLTAAFITLLHGLVMLACYVGVTYAFYNNLINHGDITLHVTEYLTCVLFPTSQFCVGAADIAADVTPIMFSGVVAALVPMVLCGSELCKPRVWIDLYFLFRGLTKIKWRGTFKGLARDLGLILLSDSTSPMTITTLEETMIEEAEGGGVGPEYTDNNSVESDEEALPVAEGWRRGRVVLIVIQRKDMDGSDIGKEIEMDDATRHV